MSEETVSLSLGDDVLEKAELVGAEVVVSLVALGLSDGDDDGDEEAELEVEGDRREVTDIVAMIVSS